MQASPMLKLTLMIAMMTTYAEWFIRTYEMRAVYPFDSTRVLPAQAGDDRLREVMLETPDGETLILWVAAPGEDEPTILYLPGNAGNLATRMPRFSYFLDQGFGLVALAYRGSSGSTGSPNETLLSEDAVLAFDSMAQFIQPHDGSVVLYGESLGTAMATKIAVVRHSAGVVLEAPFTSFVELGKYQYPTLDLSNILSQFWDTAGIIAQMDEPLLILHGTDDELVPFEQGEAIFQLAGSVDKSMVALAGIGHHGLWTPKAVGAINQFLHRLGGAN